VDFLHANVCHKEAQSVVFFPGLLCSLWLLVTRGRFEPLGRNREPSQILAKHSRKLLLRTENDANSKDSWGSRIGGRVRLLFAFFANKPLAEIWLASRPGPQVTRLEKHEDEVGGILV